MMILNRIKITLGLCVPCIVFIIILLIPAESFVTVWKEPGDWVGGKRTLIVYVNAKEDAAFKNEVEAMLEKWNTANHGKNDWILVMEKDEKKAKDADVTVQTADLSKEPHEEGESVLGVANYSGPKSAKKMDKMAVQIEKASEGGERKWALLHELGHCLRLDHTTSENAVMTEYVGTPPILEPSSDDVKEADASNRDKSCALEPQSSVVGGTTSPIAIIAELGSGVDFSDATSIDISCLTGPYFDVVPGSISWTSSQIDAVLAVYNSASHNEVMGIHVVYPDTFIDYTEILTVTEDAPTPGYDPHAVGRSDKVIFECSPAFLDGSASYHDDPSVFFSGLWMADNGVGILNEAGEIYFDAGLHTATLKVNDYYARSSSDTVGITVLPSFDNIDIHTRLDDSGSRERWRNVGNVYTVAEFDFQTNNWQGWSTGRVDGGKVFAGLQSNMPDKDPCNNNVGTQINFTSGSSLPSSDYPGLYDIPPVDPEDGFAVNTMVISPEIDLNPGGTIPPTASGLILEYQMYEDLPLEDLIFHYWCVRSIKNGLAGPWVNTDMIYYGNSRRFEKQIVDIAPLIEESADTIQIGIGVVDKFNQWYGILTDVTFLTPTPWLDNVALYRIDTEGPTWQVNDIDLFQDNFSSDGTVTGTVRIDMAKDLLPRGYSNIRPGDSAVVFVGDFTAGLDDEHVGGGPAVYIHVKDLPGRSGPSISGDLSRWPFVKDDGWTVLRCDSVYVNGTTAIDGRFCVDLNDDLYTPGDVIQYYFSARNSVGMTVYWSMGAGKTPVEEIVRTVPCETACLPTGNSDILFVNRFDNRGGQVYFESAFGVLDITPDRYDVLGPTSLACNTLASRAVPAQIIGSYKIIIWSSGDLSDGTVGDKAKQAADDAQLFRQFLDGSSHRVGVYLTGDGIADELKQLYPGTLAGFLDYSVEGDSYYELTGGLSSGGVASPLVSGAPGGIFYHGGVPDVFYIDGGCPEMNGFDVITPQGAAQIQMRYPDFGGMPHYSTLSQETPSNSMGYPARVVMEGFSFHLIRDVGHADLPARVHHLVDILGWFDEDVGPPTGEGDEMPRKYNLFQNYPNPFNPSTIIAFSLAERSNVKLNVYNVAGQLVKTLVDEERPRGYYDDVIWNGRDNRGELVSSGVYIYRLEAGKYASSKKLIFIR